MMYLSIGQLIAIGCTLEYERIRLLSLLRMHANPKRIKIQRMRLRRLRTTAEELTALQPVTSSRFIVTHHSAVEAPKRLYNNLLGYRKDFEKLKES